MLAVTTIDPYVFTVSVQDAAGMKIKNTQSVKVYIVSVPTLVVNIQLLSESWLRSTTVVVNNEDKLALAALCTSSDEGKLSYDWSISPPLKATDQMMETILPAGKDKDILIISGGFGALVPGFQYLITVQCLEVPTIEGSTLTIQGKSTYTVQVNDAPAGGSCSVCLLGANGCQKRGDPIVDTFRISCDNWADQDSPLLYRFGFNLVGGQVAWSAFRSSSFVDVVFPAGQVQIFAEVQDSFGASSGIMDLTSKSLVLIGLSQNSRRLSGSGINWIIALQNLNDLVSKQSTKDINSMLNSVGIQMWSEIQNGQLGLSDGKNLSEILLLSAQKGLTFAVKTSDNVCESYGVVEKLSHVSVLSLSSAQLIANIIDFGLLDRSNMMSLDPDCVTSASNSLGLAISALKLVSRSTVDEWNIAAIGAEAFDRLTNLYLFTATVLDNPFVVENNVSSHVFLRRDKSVFGQTFLIPIKADVFNSKRVQASFTLPRSLEMNLFNLLNGSLPSSFNMHLSVVDFAPAAKNLEVRSPLVGLSMFTTSSVVPLNVQNLSQPILVSIPIRTMPQSAWSTFKYQAVCMFWDPQYGNYSSEGCNVVDVGLENVVCQVNHLSEFVVVQDTNRIADTSSTNVTVQFSQIFAAVGNLSLATAIATSKWVQTEISGSQAQVLAAAAIQQAGGFGVPCKAAVPFLAVPGLVMKTMEGVVYPAGFAVSIQTSMPSMLAMALAPVISSVVTLTGVVSNSSIPIKIQISAYPLFSARRSGSLLSRRDSHCDTGTEWRYTKQGMPLNFACNCPANLLCSGETTCSISPKANDSWMVIKLNSSVCATQTTQAMAVNPAAPKTTTSLPSQISTPTPAQPKSTDDSLALGLGLGLGLGLPLALAVAFIVVKKNSSGKEAPLNIVQQSDSARSEQAAAITATTEAPQTHAESQGLTPGLVFTDITPSEATLSELQESEAALTAKQTSTITFEQSAWA